MVESNSDDLELYLQNPAGFGQERGGGCTVGAVGVRGGLVGIQEQSLALRRGELPDRTLCTVQDTDCT